MPTNNDYFDGDKGVVYLQPKGANTPCYPIPCHNLDGVEANLGDTVTRLCKGADGKYHAVHRSQGAPSEATLTLESWLPRTRNFLQIQAKRRCPMPVYLHHYNCGRPDTFLNYDHGELIANTLITNKTKSAQVRGNLDAGEGPADMAGLAWDLSGEPEPEDYWKLVENTRTIAEDEPLRDIAFSADARCTGPCGELQDYCERGSIAADASTGLAAEVWATTDGWVNGAAIGTSPFAADENVASVQMFDLDRDTIRLIAARGTTDGANPAEIAYADFDRITETWTAWTNVNVGSTNGEYALHGGALFALDGRHIWLCTDQGNVYFCNDNGVTWTDQGAPVPGTGAEGLYCVRFVDERYGMCVGGTTGASSVLLTTTDGGVHWTLGTGPLSKILTGVSVIDGQRSWVTEEDGTAYFTNNWGAAWTQRVLPLTATALGDVDFIDEFCGAIVGNYNDTDDYAIIYRTFNGGYDWETYVHPTAFDSALQYYGLNSVWVCDYNHIFAVGELVDSVGLIMELSPIGSV